MPQTLTTIYTDGTQITRAYFDLTGFELKFQCSHCGKVHADEMDAEECCRPEVFDVPCCSLCGQDHDTEEDAKACCAEEKAAAQEEFIPVILAFGKVEKNGKDK